MRYPEGKVKEAILHPDIEIRVRAISYFAKSFSTDPALMPLVIKAVETYGREDESCRMIAAARHLAQSEHTIAWAIDELNDESCGNYENYAYNLSMVLVEADASLLLPRESDILKARHFLGSLGAAIAERLQMLSWDQATCWQRLEEFCEQAKDKQYTNEVHLDDAHRIVEALARYGQGCEAKTLELLAVQVDDDSNYPMNWLEPLAVRLAGQARLESAIPLIVAKLHEDADLLSQECAEALTRIGTPSVLQAVAEAFPNAEWHFRLYAAGVFADIHSDLAVETCLKLFHHEPNENIRGQIAQALLSQFAREGVELTRQLLVGRKLDFESRGLRSDLLETCAITGERFPEFDEWLAAEAAEREEHTRRVKELEGDPLGMITFALEKLTGKKMADLPSTKPSPPALRSAPPLPFQQEPAARHKIGRNDPCPCRSGKKFKNCCMKKGRF